MPIDDRDMSILVVGTLAFDSVETPFGKRDNILGGSASFLGVCASHFSPVQLVGIVGADFPQEHLDYFESRGMDTQGVDRVDGKTFRWRGVYEADINVRHTLETQLNVLEQFQPNLPEPYRKTKHVVLGNFDPALQLAVLEQMDGPEFVAADTMNFWIEGHRKALEKTLERVDLLLLNDEEARQLSGEYNLVHAAEKIRALGPSMLVIKRGEHGATLFTEDIVFSAPAFPIDVIQDPTGAGDSFAGGMMGYLARRQRRDAQTVRQGIIIGSVMASFSVEDFSIDRLRTIKNGEIRQRFADFKALTDFDAEGNGIWE